MIKYLQKAFSLVEAVVAIGIFAVIAAALVTLATSGSGNFGKVGETYAAENLAASSLEIVRRMSDKAWNSLPVGEGVLVKQNGEYVFQSSSQPQTLGDYERLIRVDYGCRQTDGSIVDCPAGSQDANLKKITATVSWQDALQDAGQIERITYISNWQSTDWLQTDWSGGDNQVIWSDETQFYTQSYLNYEQTGELSLALTEPECQGQSWDFLDKNNYTYDKKEITVADSLAIAEPQAAGDPFELLSQSRIANRYEVLKMEQVDSDTIVTLENYTWRDSCSLAAYNYENNRFVESDRLVINSDRLCGNYDITSVGGNVFMLINNQQLVSRMHTVYVSNSGDIGQDWIDTLDIPSTADQPARYRTKPDLFLIAPGVVGLTYYIPKGGWNNRYFEDYLDVYYLASNNSIFSFITETDFSDTDTVPRMKPYDQSQGLWVYLGMNFVNERVSITPFKFDSNGEIEEWGQEYDAGAWKDMPSDNEFYFDTLDGNRMMLAVTTDQGVRVKTFQLSSASPFKVNSQIDDWLMNDDQWLLPSAKLAENIYGLPSVDRNTYLSLLQLNSDGSINKTVKSQEIGKGAWWEAYDSFSPVENRIIIPNDGNLYYYEMNQAAAGGSVYDIEPNTGYSLAEGAILSGFVETANKQNGEIYYQLSDDSGATWYYWNGSTWQAAGQGDYNTADIVNDNISDFNESGSGYKFRAWLMPDSGSVSLDLISIECQQVGVPDRDPTPGVPVTPGDDPAAGDGDYYLSGSLTSSARLLDPNQVWQAISWRGEQPEGTNIRFQVRGAEDDQGQPGAWSDWYGPGGVDTYFEQSGGDDLPLVVSDYGWLQYKLEMSGDGSATPILYEVLINYQ